jgi:RNA:NAD 2'-phosphotransferase (TPT1/KptA family)
MDEQGFVSLKEFIAAQEAKGAISLAQASSYHRDTRPTRGRYQVSNDLIRATTATRPC